MNHAPLRSLATTSARGTKPIEALFGRSALDRLESLEYWLIEPGERAIAPLANAKLAGLRKLFVSHIGDRKQLDVVPSIGCLRQITSLALSPFELTTRDVESVFAPLVALEELRLGVSRMNEAADAKLAELLRFEGMRVLDLAVQSTETLHVLTGASRNADLRALSMSFHTLTPSATMALIGRGFSSFRVLDLCDVIHFPAESFAALVSGPGLGRLHTLNLQNSSIDDEKLGILAKSPLIARLRSLDLR